MRRSGVRSPSAPPSNIPSILRNFSEPTAFSRPTEGIITGGKLANARLEHVWVEAATDFEPSRGAVNKAADSWIPMDPSFKQYAFQTGLDLASVSTVDLQAVAVNYVNSGTINETEGWISGFDPTILQNAQTQMQTDLQTYLSNQPTPPTVGDVIGGRNTIIQDDKGFAGALSNKVVVKGTVMDKLPSVLQLRITIQLGQNSDLFPQASVTLPFAVVNNEKVTVSFKPATADDEAVLLSLLPEGEITDISQLPSSIPGYLINVVPELKVNGITKATGPAQTLGSDFLLTTTQHFVGRAADTKRAVIASGSYVAVTTVGGSVSVTALQKLQTAVTNTKTILESGDATLISTLTGDSILGDMFYAGVLGYYAQLLTYNYFIAQPQGGHLSLLATTGTYGYVPKVTFLFGLPLSLTPGGIQMDLYQEAVTTQMNDGNLETRRAFLLQDGVLFSALEHAVPEQMFNNDPNNPVEAVSAVKALQKAAAAGQRIYQITKDNKATTLPMIHHDPGTMTEIRDARNAGKVVITHTDAISVPGWSGAGYIILDPVVGDGAFKIGGGMNGAWFTGFFFGILLSSLFVLLLTVGEVTAATGGLLIPAVGAAILPAIAAIIAAMAAWIFVFKVVSNAYMSASDLHRQCYIGGLLTGVSTAFGLLGLAVSAVAFESSVLSEHAQRLGIGSLLFGLLGQATDGASVATCTSSTQ